LLQNRQHAVLAPLIQRRKWGEEEKRGRAVGKQQKWNGEEWEAIRVEGRERGGK